MTTAFGRWCPTNSRAAHWQLTGRMRLLESPFGVGHHILPLPAVRDAPLSAEELVDSAVPVPSGAAVGDRVPPGTVFMRKDGSCDAPPRDVPWADAVRTYDYDCLADNPDVAVGFIMPHGVVPPPTLRDTFLAATYVRVVVFAYGACTEMWVLCGMPVAAVAATLHITTDATTAVYVDDEDALNPCFDTGFDTVINPWDTKRAVVITLLPTSDSVTEIIVDVLDGQTFYVPLGMNIRRAVHAVAGHPAVVAREALKDAEGRSLSQLAATEYDWVVSSTERRVCIVTLRSTLPRDIFFEWPPPALPGARK